MNKKLGIGIVVVAFVAIAMFAGCIEIEEKAPTVTPAPTPIVTPNPTPSPTPLPEPKYSRGDILEMPLTVGERIPVVYTTTGKSYTTNKKVILDYNPLTDEYKITCVLKEGDEYYFCPDDTFYWLDRFSLERNVSAMITHVNLLTVKSWNDYQALFKHLPVEEIKSKAIWVSYDDLMRYNEKYDGEIVCYMGKVFQVSKILEDKYILLVAVTPENPDSWIIRPPKEFISFWDDNIWVNYEGERVLEDDIVFIYGEVKGLRTYEAVMGNEITIPEVDSLHMELVAKAGEWSPEIMGELMGYYYSHL